MIEYTITPIEFIKEASQLVVELTPLDNSLNVLIIHVTLNPDLLTQVLSAPTLEEQKALLRAEIILGNSGYQLQWEREIATRQEIPQSLLDQLGVRGTTPVTQEEIDGNI